MPSDFPSHSAAIWIGAKGELRLGLPASDGHSTAHSITLRSDAAGMAQLIQILSARLQSSVEKAKIGCKAVPTQALADALARGQDKLQNHEASQAEKRRKAGLTAQQLLEEAASDPGFFDGLLEQLGD